MKATRPMSMEESKLFLAFSIAERQQMALTDSEYYPFLTQIILKRIEVLNLPIRFSKYALIALSAFVRSPGEAVVLLIDCLDKFEGQEVTMEKLVELYPWGFHNEKEFAKRVDEHKERKHKWSEVY